MSVPEPRSPLSVASLSGAPLSISGAAAHPMIAEMPSAVVDLAARRGRAGDLAVAVRAAFGIDLPGPGHFAAGAAVTAVWIKPETWLLLAPRGEEGALARSVATAVGNAGSVVDQSHGKTRFRLAGAHARAVLAKGCRVDLHPSVFGPGRSAATQMAQVGTVLLQRDDGPGFELVVGASYAVPFLEWLADAAAEFAGTR